MAGSEEIYESSDINDDKCSLFDDNYWYENDLLLAAELGKTLLERNKNLEFQLNVETKETLTLRMEVDLLKKQLNTLRELNRNKMILYEDVDKHHQDLEKENLKIISENKKLKEKINVISKKTEYLEQHIEELQKIHCMTTDDAQTSPNLPLSHLTVTTDHNYRLSLNNSVSPVSSSASNQSNRNRSDESQWLEIDKMWQERVGQLEIELEAKDTRISELEMDVKSMSKKLKRAETEIEDYRIFSSTACSAPPLLSSINQSGGVAVKSDHHNEADEDRANSSNEDDTLVEDIYNSLEYDIDRVDENPIDVGYMKSGGRVLSGVTSLQSLGAVTDSKSKKLSNKESELANTTTGSDVKSHQPESLLTELESQYKTLVKQYSDLITNKETNNSNSENECCRCSKSIIPTKIQPESSSLSHNHQTLPLQISASKNNSALEFQQQLGNIFSEETRRERKLMTTQNYRPKYKALFRDAFDILKDMKQNYDPPTSQSFSSVLGDTTEK